MSVTSVTSTRNTIRTRAVVVVAAVLATIVIWVLAVPILGLTVTVPKSMGSTERVDLALAPVIFATALASLAGWALLAVLERITRKARVIWTTVAVAVFLLTLPWDPAFNATERTVIALLHLAVAAVVIPGMRRTGRTANE